MKTIVEVFVVIFILNVASTNDCSLNLNMCLLGTIATGVETLRARVKYHGTWCQ